MFAIKIILILLGIIIVPLGMHNMPKIYAADLNRPWTVWEMMVRNPVNGLKWIIRHPNDFRQYGEVLEATETGKRFQWRFRRANLLSSLRLLWRYNENHYGELYFGWKLGSAPPDLDFGMSLRPWATVGQ